MRRWLIYEYFKGDPILRLGSPYRGKLYNNVLKREHTNTKSKRYHRKNPTVDRVSQSGVPKKVAGHQLKKLCDDYNINCVDGEYKFGNVTLTITNNIGTLKRND